MYETNYEAAWKELLKQLRKDMINKRIIKTMEFLENKYTQQIDWDPR